MWPTETDASAIAWTPVLIACIIVGARMYVRYETRALGVDDWLMLIAAAWALSASAVVQSTISAVVVNQWERAQYRSKTSMSNVTVCMSLLFSKTSVGFILLRLLKPSMTHHRWFIITTLAFFQTVTWFRLISSLWPVCTPPIMAVPTITGCFEYRWSFGFAQLWNFYSMFIDLAYSTIPIIIISQLKLNRGRKIALCVLVGMGWIAVVFTLIRAISPYRPSLRKLTPLCGTMEMALVMVCGSLATLTPLYGLWAHGVPLEPARGRDPLQPGAYLGATKQPILPQNSTSTAASGQALTQHATEDIPLDIRGDRDFDITGSRQSAVPV